MTSPILINEKETLIRSWTEYGERYGIFSSEDQPIPDVWEPEIPPADKKGRLHPDALKVWYRLPETMGFLEARYDITFRGQSFVFDCPVRRYQGKVIHTKAWVEYARWIGTSFWQKGCKGDDDPGWYEKALVMRFIKGGKIGFSCTSRTCFRMWCAMHVKNGKRIDPADIYNVVQIIEGIQQAETAKKVVSEWFGQDLAKFTSSGKWKKKQHRLKVSKQAIYGLIAKYENFHRKDAAPLLKDAAVLLHSSPVVRYHGRLFSEDHVYISRSILFRDTLREMGAAIRLFLFLLIRQEEAARHNQFGIKTTDVEVAEASGIPRATVMRYRQKLCAGGYLTIKKGVWKVHYNKTKVVNT
jgi:hypothetical protein